MTLMQKGTVCMFRGTPMAGSNVYSRRFNALDADNVVVDTIIWHSDGSYDTEPNEDANDADSRELQRGFALWAKAVNRSSGGQLHAEHQYGANGEVGVRNVSTTREPDPSLLARQTRRYTAGKSVKFEPVH